MAFNLASLHGAMLTVLHVLPGRECSEDCHGLDAIRLLHEAADDCQRHAAVKAQLFAASQRLCELLDEVLSPQLKENVNWRGICRVGNVAKTVSEYVDAASADLVILSTKPRRWWLPFPSTFRAIARRVRAHVVVVHGQTVLDCAPDSNRVPGCP